MKDWKDILDEQVLYQYGRNDIEFRDDATKELFGKFLGGLRTSYNFIRRPWPNAL